MLRPEVTVPDAQAGVLDALETRIADLRAVAGTPARRPRRRLRRPDHLRRPAVLPDPVGRHRLNGSAAVQQAELVALRIGQDGEGLVALLAFRMTDPRRAKPPRPQIQRLPSHIRADQSSYGINCPTKIGKK